MPPRYVDGDISARVIRYTSCLVLGYGFQGRRIEWRYFRLHQIKVGGRPPSWIISNGHRPISATAHAIHLCSAHRADGAVNFAIAQLSCNCWFLKFAKFGSKYSCMKSWLLGHRPTHRICYGGDAMLIF